MSAPAGDRWVTCAEYAAGPFTEARAAAVLRDTEHSGRCPLAHEVVISAVPPARAGRYWEKEGPLAP